MIHMSPPYDPAGATLSVLVVDDDAVLLHLLEHILSQDGYRCAAVKTMEEGRAALRGMSFDLVILDVELPDGTGVELCREIRKTSDVPILILTVDGREETLVPALEGGADDYVIKPFNVRELLARIRAILRRRVGVAVGVGASGHTSGHVEIDTRLQVARVRGDEVILTPTEFRLLQILLRAPGVTVAPSRIVEEIWGFSGKGDEALVRMHVTRLRKKLEARCGHHDHIINRRAVGYRFEADPLN